jgi:hypothetical protein
MTSFSEGITGHHKLPSEIALKFAPIFTRYLPGWSVDNVSNYSAAPSVQTAAVQMQRIMQSGGHSWYNKALEGLLGKIDEANYCDSNRI